MPADHVHTPVSVAGKTAIVLGGTSGIGRAIALGFAADGANVVASSRRDAAVETAADEIESLGGSTLRLTADVTDRDSLVDLREAVVGELGGVDVLVNSGGAIAREDILTVDETEWRRVFGVQLDGVLRAIQVFAPDLHGGSVINVVSLSALMGIPDLAAYSAAKGGLDALTRVAAKDLGPAVRVNAVRPGFIETPQTGDVYGQDSHRRERIEARAPAGRMGRSEEIVGAALYLASDSASYTTGEILTVDGGFTTAAF